MRRMPHESCPAFSNRCIKTLTQQSDEQKNVTRQWQYPPFLPSAPACNDGSIPANLPPARVGSKLRDEACFML